MTSGDAAQNDAQAINGSAFTQVHVDCPSENGIHTAAFPRHDQESAIDPKTPRQAPLTGSFQRLLLARTASTDSLADVPRIVQQTALSTFSYVVKQALLLAKLSLTLYFYLGFGIRWTWRFIRLCVFAGFLLPGFVQMIVFYYFSPRVTRSVTYGPRPRNTLDIYLPRHHMRDLQDPIPVVIYITGGAWIIGYKAWGSLLARRLSRYGVIVCCLDYRNFPQGNLEDMLEDCNTGISWVMRHIGSRGGNPDQMYIVGQSAGGQLGALTLIAQAEAQLTSNGKRVLGSTPAWDPRAVKAFIGVSGAYDVYALADHLDRRGLYKSIFGRIMSVHGQPAFKALSPLYAFHNGHAALWKLLPRMLLLHGTGDNSVPCEIAVEFSTLLKAGGVDSEVKLYVGKTHTQPLIEDPMSGGRDVLTDEILTVVTGKEQNNVQFAMCPAVLIRLASAVCPF